MNTHINFTQPISISSEESDYLDNLRTKAHMKKTSKPRSTRKTSQVKRKPVIKIEMDLEKNSVSLVGPPGRASTSKNLAANIPVFNNNSLFASLNTSTNFQSVKKFTPRALLKRSLSHSARVLTTKANQLRG